MEPIINPNVLNLLNDGRLGLGDKLDIEITVIEAEKGFAKLSVIYKTKGGNNVAAFNEVIVECGAALILENASDITLSPA